ncbi:hypothetical protein PG997_002093 [Apiospora hydei]|uniref:F-box domain-containing protein n=1 Tax=Apiospora hydei TaxID=1337664 RepID=A0ABR1X879_9PEZI
MKGNGASVELRCRQLHGPAGPGWDISQPSWPVRRRVYIEAGLLIGEDIILQWRWDCNYRDPDSQVDEGYRFVYNILQTCKAVYDEVRGLVYAENRIIVDQRNVVYGLVQLRRLSPRACSQLRSLYVHLYLEAPPDPIRYKNDKKKFPPSPPLERGCVVEAWQAAADYVLAHANREELRLQLICDTGHKAATTNVLGPLIAHPGSLRDCEIRLAPKRDDKLCSLARNAALRVKGLDVELHDKPVRFMDLPPEIRLHILEYTDLVTPCKEIEWRPGCRGGFSVTFADRAYRHQTDACYTTRREAQGWRRFVNCQSSSSSHLLPTQSLSSSDTHRTGSVCTARQSGYAPRCQCWAPPRALLLVSRALHDEAIATLYAANRVIVRPELGWHASSSELGHHGMSQTVLHPTRRAGRTQLNAEQFLARRPAAALSRLRTLELVFPGLLVGATTTSSDDDALCVAWRAAVRRLREQQGAGLAALTLVVHMRLAIDEPRISTPWFPHRKRDVSGPPDTWCIMAVDGRRHFECYVEYLTERRGVDEQNTWTAHAALLEPLRELCEAGLRRLFVFLESGWHWSPPRGCTPQSCQGRRGGEVHDRIREMEQVLEKGVMGEEYDSAAEGKMEELPSQWMLHVE